MAKKAKKKTKKDITITLKFPDGATPKEASAFKHGASGPADRVRWWNKTDRGLTITFSAWPFVDAPQTISIAAGKKSKWFTIYSSAGMGRYGYAVTPPMTAPGSPPDSPAVIVED